MFLYRKNLILVPAEVDGSSLTKGILSLDCYNEKTICTLRIYNLNYQNDLTVGIAVNKILHKAKVSPQEAKSATFDLNVVVRNTDSISAVVLDIGTSSYKTILWGSTTLNSNWTSTLSMMLEDQTDIPKQNYGEKFCQSSSQNIKQENSAFENENKPSCEFNQGQIANKFSGVQSQTQNEYNQFKTQTEFNKQKMSSHNQSYQTQNQNFQRTTNSFNQNSQENTFSLENENLEQLKSQIKHFSSNDYSNNFYSNYANDKNFSNENLTNNDFSNENFANENCSNANYSNKNLSNIDYLGENCSNENCSNKNFANTNCSNQNCSNVDFLNENRSNDYSNGNVPNLDYSNDNISNSHFSNENVSNIDYSNDSFSVDVLKDKDIDDFTSKLMDFDENFSNNGVEPSNNFQNSASKNYDSSNTATPSFYDRISSQVSKMFNSNDAEIVLNEIIPNSKFCKINFDDNTGHYVFGVIYDDNKPKYLCYGVPAKKDSKPPKELSSYYQWLPIDVEEESGDGYYMMYQDASTGQNISVEMV